MDPVNPEPTFNPALHRVALLTACCTFPLIFMGGLVTSKHAGMSVPDWPNSYGYNMFLFPPRLWIGGILYEHVHRLMGTVVGFCATMLTLVAWGPARTGRGRRIIAAIILLLTLANVIGTTAMVIHPAKFHLAPTVSSADIISQGAVGGAGILLCGFIAWFCRNPEPRRWVRWLSTACLIAICIQGLLGGLRVDLVNLALAIVHGCFAQASFCLIILTAAVTGRWWFNAPDLSKSETGHRGRRLVILAMTAVAVVYCQLIVGAMMRHFGAGLAIPDLPLAYGKWLPPTNAAQLAAANNWRIWTEGFDDRVTLGQIWLAFGHRIGAVLVTIAILTLITAAAAQDHGSVGIRKLALILICLLVTQITLGLLTVYLRKPADIASSHVAVGALVLVTTFLIAVRSMRLYSLRSR
jgi:cytochrome c oxidase assembly protein subunit 15